MPQPVSRRSALKHVAGSTALADALAADLRGRVRHSVCKWCYKGVTLELYYPAIIRAILQTGYQGFVGQEFIPKRPDKIASLRQGVEICDV